MTASIRPFALASAHVLGFIGAIALAFHTFDYDTAPIVVLAAIGLSVLGAGLALHAAHRGRTEMWLIVGGIWVYDAMIAGLREPTIGRQLGYGLIFGGYACGALASYVTSHWIEPTS